MSINYLKYLYVKWFGSKEQKERQKALEIIYDEFVKQEKYDELKKFFKVE